MCENLAAATAEGDIYTIRRLFREEGEVKNIAPRRNWDEELMRVLRDLPRGTPVAVRFAHIRHREWSVDTHTMPRGFREWLRETRRELAPYFTTAARDLRQHLEMMSRTGNPWVPTSTLHRLFIMEYADTPAARRHNADLQTALRAFAEFRKIKRHPLEAHGGTGAKRAAARRRKSAGTWRFNPREEPVELDDEKFRAPAALTVPQMDIRIGSDGTWRPLLETMDAAKPHASSTIGAKRRRTDHPPQETEAGEIIE